MHRDIKAENILLNKSKEYETLKLADFGSSCEFERGKLLQGVVGTPYYVAPEIMKMDDTNK